MVDFLFRSKYKRESDLADARELLARYGAEAKEIAKERASDSRLTLRNRRHWHRISRLVAHLESRARKGKR